MNERMAKLMGWHKRMAEWGEFGAECMCWLNDMGEIMEYVGNWHPDTDIAQALMCADKYNIGLEIYQLYDGGWKVGLLGAGISRSEIPLAICKAILEVK